MSDAIPKEPGIYLAYLDVWDRHITYLEDPDIQESALGGPDTTTRVQICLASKAPQAGRWRSYKRK